MRRTPTQAPRQRLWSALGAGLLLLALAGQARAVTVDEIEQRIRKKLDQRWDFNNLVVRVEPYSQPETDKGYLKSILMQADVAKWKGVALRPIYLRSEDVVLDLPALLVDNKLETKSSKKTTFLAKISEADLNGLFKKKNMPIKNPKIELGQGDVTFTGTYQVGRLGSNLKLNGVFTVKNETHLWFTARKGWVSGIPLPAALLNQVLSLLNPLLDFSELPFSPRVKKFEIKDKAIAVEG